MFFDRAPCYNSVVNNLLDAKFFFLNSFTSVPYMFRAALCSSSGQSIVSIRHLVYFTLCGWLCGMQVWMEHLNMHTTQSPTQSKIYQPSYWYNWLSWWCAQGCSKHVGGKVNELRKKNFASSRLFTTEFRPVFKNIKLFLYREMMAFGIVI